MIPVCTFHRAPGNPLSCYQCSLRERTMPADRLADRWHHWCGDTAWTAALDEFAMLGGYAEDWGGVPRSHSAIRLCFVLILPDGTRLPNTRNTIAAIRHAVEIARATGRLL